MTKEPKVFIILVNYNGFSDTEDCIKSIFKNKYLNYRIVVVDNGSNKKGIDDLALKYKEVIFLKTAENVGFSAGNNIGIRYALKENADYIVLLNNDTVVTRDFLSKAIERLEQDKNKEIGLLIGKINYYFDKNKAWYAGGHITRWFSRVIHFDSVEANNNSEEMFVNYATGCYYCLPATVIKRVGFLPEEYFLYCEDTDYSTAVINSGLKILYFPDSVIFHKVNSSTGNQSNLYKYYTTRNKFYYIDKYKNGLEWMLSMGYQYAKSLRNFFLRGKNPSYIWAIKDFQDKKMGKSLRDF